MKPKKQIHESNDMLFQMRLIQMINPSHPLVVLADAIDWNAFDKDIAALYCDNNGRPAVASRLMIGLLYLKATFHESDEAVVEKWVENPYWQYFCGMEFMQHEFPIDASSLATFRKRVGKDLLEKMHSLTLQAALAFGAAKPKDFAKVNVDTTVQEKAIAYPTDAKLYFKGIRILMKLAHKNDIVLRQSYCRVSRFQLQKYGRYAHAKQFNRATKAKKKLHTFLGRIIRDITRKLTKPVCFRLKTMLQRATKIWHQKQNDKNKLYAYHAPEVVCMSKGKAHKRYEFGSKVGFVSSIKSHFILSAISFDGNPFDGHTLKENVAHAQKLSGIDIAHINVDKGYKGHGIKKEEMGMDVLISGTRGLSRGLKKLLRKRQAIEPVIGHMKSDHHLGRNYLHHKQGDQINAIAAAIGFNMRKLLKFLFVDIF